MLKPLGDKVIVKMEKMEETTKNGIVLPSTAVEKSSIAEVIAVGPGGNVEGKEVTMSVKVGDKVVFEKYAGTQIKYDNVDYTIIKQSDILAIVE